MSRPFESAFAGPGESPGFLLWQVTNSWQRMQRAALAQLDLTHVQFVLLACVAWMQREAPLTQARLAEHARTDPMMTSQVLRALERKGLIRRAPHPTDARARALEATEAGMALARESVARVEAVDAEFFAPLRESQPELVRMLQALAVTGLHGSDGARTGR
jgi:MarR family transcriptional regulator, organic hydroperoxide resistance regulator